MQWRNRRESQNVEDVRGRSGGRVVGGGAGLLVLILISLALGIDPIPLLQNLPQTSVQTTASSVEEEELVQFIRVVLADTEDVWNQQFSAIGRRYQEPTLVLFRDQVGSGCGFASAATGPFYCPLDQKLYLDLSFFAELSRRFGAPGDFAQAYVIAHEVGHHVQTLLGITQRVHTAKGRVSEAEYNQLSVRLELQADYLAGVWAHHTDREKQVLDIGDIEEALQAASAIGDDRLQRQTQGYVVPESFTHGSSEQRYRWFKRGFDSGDILAGDTFNTSAL